MNIPKFMSQYDRLAWVFCTHTSLGPCPMVIFSDLVNSNKNQCESTNQEWERWPNVWMSTVLNAGYYYTPLLYACCFWIICLDTGVQPQLNLPCVWILPLGPGALGGASQGLCCLVEVSPSYPVPINSPVSGVVSGEAGWTVRGIHLHHVLGTSQVWASGPDLRPG